MAYFEVSWKQESVARRVECHNTRRCWPRKQVRLGLQDRLSERFVGLRHERQSIRRGPSTFDRVPAAARRAPHVRELQLPAASVEGWSVSVDTAGILRERLR